MWFTMILHACSEWHSLEPVRPLRLTSIEYWAIQASRAQGSGTEYGRPCFFIYFFSPKRMVLSWESTWVRSEPALSWRETRAGFTQAQHLWGRCHFTVRPNWDCGINLSSPRPGVEPDRPTHVHSHLTLSQEVTPVQMDQALNLGDSGWKMS